MKKYLLAAVAALALGGAANAGVTCMPTGGGGQYCSDPMNGWSSTTMPTGGGGSYTTDNRGNGWSTMPTGGGGSYTATIPNFRSNRW